MKEEDYSEHDWYDRFYQVLDVDSGYRRSPDPYAEPPGYVMEALRFTLKESLIDIEKRYHCQRILLDDDSARAAMRLLNRFDLTMDFENLLIVLPAVAFSPYLSDAYCDMKHYGIIEHDLNYELFLELAKPVREALRPFADFRHRHESYLTEEVRRYLIGPNYDDLIEYRRHLYVYVDATEYTGMNAGQFDQLRDLLAMLSGIAIHRTDIHLPAFSDKTDRTGYVHQSQWNDIPESDMGSFIDAGSEGAYRVDAYNLSEGMGKSLKGLLYALIYDQADDPVVLHLTRDAGDRPLTLIYNGSKMAIPCLQIHYDPETPVDLDDLVSRMISFHGGFFIDYWRLESIFLGACRPRRVFPEQAAIETIESDEFVQPIDETGMQTVVCSRTPASRRSSHMRILEYHTDDGDEKNIRRMVEHGFLYWHLGRDGNYRIGKSGEMYGAILQSFDRLYPFQLIRKGREYDEIDSQDPLESAFRKIVLYLEYMTDETICLSSYQANKIKEFLSKLANHDLDSVLQGLCPCGTVERDSNSVYKSLQEDSVISGDISIEEFSDLHAPVKTILSQILNDDVQTAPVEDSRLCVLPAYGLRDGFILRGDVSALSEEFIRDHSNDSNLATSVCRTIAHMENTCRIDETELLPSDVIYLCRLVRELCLYGNFMAITRCIEAINDSEPDDAIRRLLTISPVHRGDGSGLLKLIEPIRDAFKGKLKSRSPAYL